MNKQIQIDGYIYKQIDRYRHYDQWSCFECAHPACARCGKVSKDVVRTTTLVNGQYFCITCKFQTCVICKKARQRIDKGNAFGSYTCPDCFSSNGKCLNCKKEFIPLPNQKYCSQTCRYPHCAFNKCTVPRPRGSVYGFDQMPVWFCKLHK